MRDSVTFIHAADLHLDAPFKGIAAEDGRIGTELADATYAAWHGVVDEALAREVDFVVVAGDAFNAAEKSLRAQLRFRAEAERLKDADIRLLVVHGNHDPASGWSAGLVLPDNVHVFSASEVERVEIRGDDEVVAAVYGRSFGKAAETANLSLGFKRQPGDAVAIAVLHANVGGRPEYDNYAPASLDDLRAAGMDYWALGHIHKQEFLSQDPWVVYAGSSQGLNPKEMGAHGCVVVEVSRAGVASCVHVETAPIGWAFAEVDATEADGIDAVRDLICAACETQRAEQGRAVVMRIALTGRSAAHAVLARPGILEQLLDDLRQDQASATPWVWLDRLDDRTAPVMDLEAIRASRDFAGDLVFVADELQADEDQLRGVLDELMKDPAAKLGKAYEAGIEPVDALVAARDLALDLLLAEGEAR